MRARAVGAVLTRFGLVPSLLAAALLAATSGLPIRFDLRTLQAQARLAPLDLPRGNDFVVVTRDNSVASATLVQFGLAHWSFPHGRRLWLVPRERADGVWMGGFWAVSMDGTASVLESSSGTPAWHAAGALPDWPQILERAVVVYEDAELREQFERRLPELRGASRVEVAPVPGQPGLAVQRPTLRVGLRQLLRLAALVGLALAGASWLAGRAGVTRAARPLALAVGGSAALALAIGATYVAGQVAPWAYRWMPLLLWATTLVALARWAGRAHADNPPSWRLPPRWILAAILFAGMALVRLDFDGDTYTSYLPLARYYLLNGQHAPADPGVGAVVQGAVYPPGYPLCLALSAWAADAPSDASSFALGPATSQAIALYRVAIIALDLACLAALGSLASLLGLGRGGGAALTLAGLWIPVLRGEHSSAETILVPVVGLALCALWGGWRAGSAPLLAAGVLLGACGTLLKLDGAVFFGLLLVPVAVAGRHVVIRAPRGWLWLGAAVALGLLPLVAWRLSGPAANAAFEPRSATEVGRTLFHLIPQALRLVISHELWLPLGVVLPLALVLALAARQPGPTFIALGIVANVAFWPLVYGFSTLGAATHMETSLPRVLMAPALAAFVCLAGVLESSPGAGSAAAP